MSQLPHPLQDLRLSLLCRCHTPGANTQTVTTVSLLGGWFCRCAADLTGSCSSTDNQGRAACQCQPRVIATLKKDQI